MIYNKLGTTDLSVSAVGLGAWQFNGEWGKKFNQNDVCEILGVAESLGINFIDTAECYGDHLSEKFIGQFLKRNSRHKWIIATKFGHKYKGFLDAEDRWSPKEVKQQLEDSLIALNTEYIDIYQFHSGSDEVFNNHELWRVLKEEKRAGKIRHLGLSISEDVVLGNDLLQINKVREFGIDVIQVRYNWLQKEAENVLIPQCLKFGLGIVARQPLAYGYLSGKYNAESEFPENDVRHWQNRETFLKTMKSIDKLKSKLRRNTNPAKWSIDWCFKNQGITSVIVGCKTSDQVKSAVEAIRIYANKD